MALPLGQNPPVDAQQEAAARAAAEATRQQRFAAWAEATRKTGARCGLTIRNAAQVCGEPASGHCHECQRAFCDVHASRDLGGAFWRAVDLCWECQDRAVAAKYEQDRVEGDRLAAVRGARLEELRHAEERAQVRQRRAAAAARRRVRVRRLGAGFVGGLLVAAGAAAGLRVDDELLSATLPVGPVVPGEATTPYVVLAMLAVAASVVTLLYPTRLGAGAGVVGRVASIVGFLYLVATAGTQLWQEQAQHLAWGPFVAALGGAGAWLIGAHLAYQPVAQVRGAGQPYRGLNIAVAVVVVVVLAAAFALYQIGAAPPA
jgi:hypothetical protein